MAGFALALVASSLLLLCVRVREVAAESGEPVPILAWSNRDTFSSVTADGGTNKMDVESLVQRSKFSDLGFIFVFRTEKLAFEDIAKYGSVYADNTDDDSCALCNIKAEMDNAVTSLWMGGEESAASLLIEEIAAKIDMSPNFISGMEDVAVIFGQPQLLVVDLPYGGGEAEFAQQDAMVAEVLEAVHHLDAAYAAFYTGMVTEALQDSMFAPLLAKRAAPSLMTSSRPCPVSYGVKDSDGSYCALLCMTNSTIYYWESQGDLNQGDEPCVAKITAFDEKGVSGCNSSTIGPYPSIFATVQGNCSDEEADDSPEEKLEIEIEFTFPEGVFEHAGQWTLGTGSWQMMIIVGPFNLSRYGERKLVYPFSVPIGFSYACQTDSTATTNIFSNPNRFAQISNDTADEEDVVARNDWGSPVIQFTEIQVQAYGYLRVDSPIFYPAYDCNGYFTLPSFMGVFCVGIVLVVLYIAIICAFNHETVDRFEDPRAPTISVENLH